MAGVNAKAQIGQTGQFLEGVAVDTPAGERLFREGVAVSDPEFPEARQRVLDAEPLEDDWGSVVRVVGLTAALTQAIAALNKIDKNTGQLPTSGSSSSVNASATQVTLLGANANRKGATIYNDSISNPLRVSLGPTASATTFTVIVASEGYFEVPFGYAGVITGVWAAATGAARVTELT